jgi:hypothetical protein
MRHAVSHPLNGVHAFLKSSKKAGIIFLLNRSP